MAAASAAAAAADSPIEITSTGDLGWCSGTVYSAESQCFFA